MGREYLAGGCGFALSIQLRELGSGLAASGGCRSHASRSQCRACSFFGSTSPTPTTGRLSEQPFPPDRPLEAVDQGCFVSSFRVAVKASTHFTVS